MKKRYIINLIVIIAIFITSCTNKSASTIPINTHPIKIQDDVTASSNIMFDSNNNIYIYCKSKIYKYTSDEREFSTITLPSNKICTLYNDKLYLISLHDEIIELNLDGKELNKSKINYDDNLLILKVIPTKKQYFIMCQNEFDETVSLFDINGNIIYQDIQDCINYKDNNIILLTKNEYSENKLLFYDYEDRNITKEIAINNDITNLQYNSTNDTLLALSNENNSITKFSNLETTQPKMKSIFISNYNYTDTYINNELIYKLDLINHKVNIFKTLNSKILNILAPSNDINNLIYLKNSINLFMENNLDVTINISSTSCFDYESKLKTKFMSKDSDFDIFYISSPTLTHYLENKTMLDLNEDNNIKEKFNEMFDGIYKNCSYKDYLFGVPIDMYFVYLFKLNNDLFNYFDLKKTNFNWTLDDAIKYMNTYNLKNQGIYLNSFYGDITYTWTNFVFPLYYSNIKNDDEILLDKGTLKKYITYTKTLYDNNCITNEFNGNNTLLNYSSLHNNDSILLFPSLKENSKYPIIIDYLAINRYTNNKDLSLDFINTFISKFCIKQNEFNIPLYKDKTLYKGTNLYPFISDIDCYNRYAYYLKNSIRYDNNLPTCGDIVGDYIYGNLSLDEVADKIIEIMKMKLHE